MVRGAVPASRSWELSLQQVFRDMRGPSPDKPREQFNGLTERNSVRPMREAEIAQKQISVHRDLLGAMIARMGGCVEFEAGQHIDVFV